MVGLLLDIAAIASFSGEHGGAEAAVWLDRFLQRATEIGRRHDMRPVKAEGDGILLVGQSQEEALKVAFALSEELVPEHGYLPVHVGVHRGDVVELDDDSGAAVSLAARVTVAAHPGEVRPASR